MAYLKMSLNEKALIDFEEALRLDDKTDLPLSSLGFYYVTIKDYPKSIEYFKKAIQKAPTRASNYMDVATSYSALKNFEKAQYYYEKGLTLEPDNAAAYYNKALKLSKEGNKDFELQEHYLDHCLQLNPLFFPAKLNKAAIHRERKDNTGAIKILTELINAGVSNDYVLAIEQRGIAYRVLKMFPQALIDFQHVFHLSPTNVQNLSNIAATHLSMIQINEAWTYFLEGIYQADIQNEHSCDKDFNNILLAIQHTPFSQAENFKIQDYVHMRKSQKN